MLDELPSTLAQVRSTSRTLGAVTGRAAPVLANLAVAVRELRPAVQTLRPAAVEGQGILRGLAAAAPGLEETMGKVRGLSAPLASAMPAVRSTLCQVNPLIRYLTPYTPDFVATAVGLGAASQTYDAFGHVLRATPVVTEQALVGLPPQVHQAALTLVRSGLLQKTRELGYDPYPQPGLLGKNPDGEGVLGPAQVRTPYPRIEADC
jgi:phospholipid/cholesterol/gamma-HCH transport system substrate-binding protein